MMRHAALALSLGIAACTAAAPDTESRDEPENVGEAEQTIDSLETPSEENAIRYLEQSTFGPRRAGATQPADSIENVIEIGITQSITDQIVLTGTAFDGAATSQSLDAQLFVQAIDGPDQLRQRLAFALSQIVVVSLNGLNSPNNGACTGSPPECQGKLAMAAYLNVLHDGAFGNYKALLKNISKSAAMGRYLDMVNTRAFDANGNAVKPNENYARELLQLFTVGLNKLYETGELQLDCPVAGVYDGVADAGCTAAAGGKPLPVYTETQVQAFAAALSGWTYAKVGGSGGAADCPAIGKTNPLNYTADMLPCDVNHDKTSQTLLRGEQTTANGTATQHLNQAIANLFLDPNLPPFVCKQLIQHLVTSNPSPAYVQRVVSTFKDDGTGVRGNLAAVVRAILQDDEARGAAAPPAQTATFGHLRSPVLHLTSLVRMLDGHMDLTNGKDPGGKLSAATRAMNQYVTRPASVFSFYAPGAPLPGDATLLGPEFAIFDAATATARANVVQELLLTNAYLNAGVTISFAALPSDDNELVTWLGRYFMHGSMSSDVQVAIFDAITSPWATGNNARQKKLGTMLAVLSPEFSIQR